MLYQFLLNYVDTFGFLNVFKYLTFRTGLSVFTSLIIVLIIGGPFIKLFSNQKILNPIRDDGPEDHIIKKIGTPTICLLYTSPSPRDMRRSRMPSSA